MAKNDAPPVKAEDELPQVDEAIVAKLSDQVSAAIAIHHCS